MRKIKDRRICGQDKVFKENMEQFYKGVLKYIYKKFEKYTASYHKRRHKDQFRVAAVVQSGLREV